MGVPWEQHLIHGNTMGKAGDKLCFFRIHGNAMDHTWEWHGKMTLKKQNPWVSMGEII
jgi:hypothetical protein